MANEQSNAYIPRTVEELFHDTYQEPAENTINQFVMDNFYYEGWGELTRERYDNVYRVGVDILTMVLIEEGSGMTREELQAILETQLIPHSASLNISDYVLHTPTLSESIELRFDELQEYADLHWDNVNVREDDTLRQLVVSESLQMLESIIGNVAAARALGVISDEELYAVNNDLSPAPEVDIASDPSFVTGVMDSYLKQAQEEMIAEIQELLAAKNPEFLVRGALLTCSCGSHLRYLNQPYDYGVFVRGRPIMCAKDSKVNVNIMTFGHCSSLTPGSFERSRLVPYVPIDHDGNLMQEKPDFTSVGYVCAPSTASELWQNV